jgi:hypothetical protein
MRLIGNKIDVINDKVMDNIHWKEDNIRYSNNNIWFIQKMNIRILTNSNYLIDNIYNEVKA